RAVERDRAGVGPANVELDLLDARRGARPGEEVLHEGAAEALTGVPGVDDDREADDVGEGLAADDAVEQGVADDPTVALGDDVAAARVGGQLGDLLPKRLRGGHFVRA